VALLDDLKREAEQAKEAKEAQSARQAELDRLYRTEIAPRLIEVHRYLGEMLGHLEEAGREVCVAFEFPALGKIGNLKQGHYSLRIDGHGTPRKVSLNCECVLPEERKFAVPMAEADELRAHLIANQVVFTEWPLRNGNAPVQSLLFQARLRVRSSLSFEADIEASKIRVTSYNFEGLGSLREYPFDYARIDAAWLDGMGRYLLRESPTLGYLEISEEARALIKRRAAEEKARLERQLALSAEEPKPEPAERGLLGGLRSRLFGQGKRD
jgi:hypothetical protein